MKKWQESRNYRRIRDKKGNVIANIITVDGVEVEVTEEVYLAYSQMDRRERYQDEQREDKPHVSLELLEEYDVPLDLYLTEHGLSAEDTVIEMEDTAHAQKQKKLLAAALNDLSNEDKQLIQALFFDAISAREYARQLGVYPRTVMYRKEKLMEKLRKIIFP